jgi:FAD/FMN-containing dehydrogenase
MDQMTKVLAVNVTSYTMRVQAQMTMQHLYEAATAAGMSVVGGLLPAWAGLTLGGVMAASAHGSGYNTRSTVVSDE